MKGFKGTPGPWFVQECDDTSSMCMTVITNTEEEFSNYGETAIHPSNEAKGVCIVFHQLHPQVSCEMEDLGEANAKAIGALPDILSALKELIFLHGCEQEGIASGQPTRKQWLKAYDDGVNALEKAGIDLSEI